MTQAKIESRDIENLARAPSDDGLLRDIWYFGAVSSDVKPGCHFRQMVLGDPVLIGRTRAGKAFAMRDVCPHRLVPLSAGKQVDKDGVPMVECPNHGWLFDTNGTCKHMPSLIDGNPFDVEKIRVKHYPVHEANGIIFVYVSSNPRFFGEPDLPPPDIGLFSDKPKFVVSRVFEAPMDTASYGFFDPAHVNYVHSQWWWRPKSIALKTKTKEFIPTYLGWASKRHAPSSNSVAYRKIFGENVTTEIRYMLPGFRWESVDNGNSQLLSLSCILPLDATRTLVTQITYWNNAPLLNLVRPFFPILGNVFLSQDAQVASWQNDGLKHQKSMIYIDDADTQTKWYHKSKKEWTASRAEKRDYVNPVEATELKWRS